MAALAQDTAMAPAKLFYLAAKRLFDVVLAGAAIMLLAPVLLIGLVQSRLRSGAWLQTEVCVGRGGRPLTLRAWRAIQTDAEAGNGTYGIWSSLPRLFDVLAGRLSLVGPRPVSIDEVGACGGYAHARFGVTPGLVCIWWLRQRSNIDYGSEAEADGEYLSARSMRKDIALLARALIALAYGRQVNSWAAGQFISGIRLLNLSMNELLDAIVVAVESGARTRVAFVNPDCVNIAARDASYRGALDAFDWVCPDGIGMKIAGSLLGRPIRQNLNGTDLFPRLCATLEATGRSLFLLGARPGVAAAAAQWARARYPQLKIAGTRSGYFSSVEEDAVLAQIRESGADVLLVAMGAPRQELWLARNLEASGAVVGMGVGGLFDFYSGRIPRAPLWLREIGGEWIYRLMQEPGRMWRRYLVGNWVFLMRIVTEKFNVTLPKGSRP